ncbi:MAG: DNA polymerase III subunit gamma/tau [Alphaproteobacteria bacterium]|nr:DNA polymerase III subunit gamma/tau [Alphaproteobacteria bacterium]
MTDAQSPATPYRVLARKYRPTTFAGLVGQDVLVRTLTNAIQSGRVAHAFVLTGVRGVGKTTTARIIARALNCVGRDGKGGPTADPCGVCEHCAAITEDRHLDVLEMDAASRTGVADIRELIDGVRYAPVSARNKIYIIDEVHMLSPQAFNALLKTLEEPPPHVVFVFATTEARKIPITVLSRCQRFDLRRLDTDTMIGHLAAIAAKENVTIEANALKLIARAAEGSVRDGLSLLDQAMALGAATVTEAAAGEMLGLADRGKVLDLLDSTLAGDTKASLTAFRGMTSAGADPLVIVQDLLELVHWLTRLKVVPDAGEDLAVPEAMRTQGARMATALGMAALARAWQILLKGLNEARVAPSAETAVEMLLVRLAYIAELPTPADLVRQLGDRGETENKTPREAPARTAAPPPRASSSSFSVPTAHASGDKALDQCRHVDPVPSALPLPSAVLRTFEDLVTLADEKREARIVSVLLDRVHLVKFEDGYLEFRLDAGVPPDFVGGLKGKLDTWTGRRWVVTVSSDEGAPTLREQRALRSRVMRDAVMDHPLVTATLTAFPGAEIRQVRDIRPPPALAEPVATEESEPGGDDGEPI